MASDNKENPAVGTGEVLDLGYDPDLRGEHVIVVHDIGKDESDEGRISYPVVVELSSGIRVRGRAWPGESIESLLWAVGIDPLEAGQTIPKDQIQGKEVQVTLDRTSARDTNRPYWVFKRFAPIA
jgi:hypothetical protein